MTVTIEGELIAPEDTADLEARLMGANVLPLAEREALITNTLEQSAYYLSLVNQATDPAAFAKAGKSAAEMASHYAKRLDISKDLVLDSQVQQRRWERKLGVAIREGQSTGAILANGQRPSSDAGRSRPSDYVSNKSQLDNPYSGIYRMTDGVSDEEFEEAVTSARDEERPTKTNVVTKIREAKGTAPASEPTRTGDAKRAAKQVATFHRIINTLEANTMVIDELIRAGLDPAITDDEASRIVAGLEAFARATARVKKSLI